jgi:fumarate hydratase class II
MPNCWTMPEPMVTRPTRTEHDSLGAVEVPVNALWGAQTERSLTYFAIGAQRMPLEVIHAIAWIKWAAAEVNCELLLLGAHKARAIAKAALQVAAGDADHAFPLSAWQTGSGTQSHMNVNEVIARLATQSLRSECLTPIVDAHDEVNLGQSSNDVFPSAMHVAVALRAKFSLLPALRRLSDELALKARDFHDVVKVGRTHLQDATPLTLGQEFSGYVAQLALCEDSLRHALHAVHALAIGGTAVGTGMNTHAEFGPRVAALLAQRLDLPLVQARNLFAALAGHEALVAFHGALRMLAIALIKIAGDIRLMGSGPQAGLGELRLPANEPGSSIMPGKVNPTQVEALCMVCAQVMGHDAAIGFAASQGQFELNVYKPLIVLDTLDSLHLLADAMYSFSQHCVMHLQVDEARLRAQVQSSLMLATALAPHIGYRHTAQVAQHAHAQGRTLREAALALGAVSAEQFDLWVDARRMLGPHGLHPDGGNGVGNGHGNGLSDGNGNGNGNGNARGNGNGKAETTHGPGSNGTR